MQRIKINKIRYKEKRNECCNCKKMLTEHYEINFGKVWFNTCQSCYRKLVIQMSLAYKSEDRS